MNAYNKATESNYLQSENEIRMIANSINESFSEREKAKNRKKDKYYKNYFNNDSSWIQNLKKSYNHSGVDVIDIVTGYGFKYGQDSGKTRNVINLPNKSTKLNSRNALRIRSFTEPSDSIYISKDFLEGDELLNFKSFKSKIEMIFYFGSI